MDSQKVDMFIMTNSEKLPAGKIPYLREQLLAADDSKWTSLSVCQFKNPTTALVLSIFLGCYGVDRFYIGDTGLGVLKLITCGGVWIWTIIDWFMISDATREKITISLFRFALRKFIISQPPHTWWYAVG
jgi:TM2 domain.